jgi:hypothetical protein
MVETLLLSRCSNRTGACVEIMFSIIDISNIFCPRNPKTGFSCKKRTPPPPNHRMIFLCGTRSTRSAGTCVFHIISHAHLTDRLCDSNVDAFNVWGPWHSWWPSVARCPVLLTFSGAKDAHESCGRVNAIVSMTLLILSLLIDRVPLTHLIETVAGEDEYHETLAFVFLGQCFESFHVLIG